jgi:microcompartment protein CcmK/EutM
MKGLNKLVLITAISAASFGANAELKAIDDAVMADVSGQSGLVIEAGFGSADKTDLFAVDFAGAGITIDTFKWEVDAQQWDNSTNIVDGADLAGPGGAVKGGFIASDIAIAGAVDVTIDAVGDGVGLATALGAGSLPADAAALAALGGIGITFANSNIDFKVGDMGVYVASGNGIAGGQLSSMGSIEILGMNIDGLDLVIHGN